MPRDRDGSFEPAIVRKRQRRVSDVDEIVLSLYAKGLTTGEISAHFEQIYGASVSRDTVSRITGRGSHTHGGGKALNGWITGATDLPITGRIPSKRVLASDHTHNR